MHNVRKATRTCKLGFDQVLQLKRVIVEGWSC